MVLGFTFHFSAAASRDGGPSIQQGGPGEDNSSAHRVIGAAKQVYRLLVQADGAMKSGTAFLASGRRIVATNSHVVSGGTAYALGYVGEQGRVEWVKLEILAIFPQKDLALLQARTDLPGAALPLAADFPELTSDLYAIGFPAAADSGANVGSPLERDASFFTPSFVKGNVSRIIPEPRAQYQLQHQTPISSGYSGGPLVNSEGVVVGVSSAIHREANGIAYGVGAHDLVALISACALSQRIARVGGATNPFPYAAPSPQQSDRLDPLIRRAYEMLRRGDIAQARSTFGYAVQIKPTAEAYEGLARSFDPSVLARLPVFGDLGDPGRAQEFYGLALRAEQRKAPVAGEVSPGCGTGYCVIDETAAPGKTVVQCGSAPASASASR